MRQQACRLFAENLKLSASRMPATHRPFGLARPALSDLSIPDSEPERVEMRVKIGTSSRALKNLDVIEILDSDSEPSGSDSLPAVNLASTNDHPPAHLATAPQSPAPLPNFNEDDGDGPSPAPVRTLDLAHFAFPGNPSSSRLPSRTNSVRDIPSANEPTKKAATRPKKATLELSSEFTDKDMDKVLKCISCDARWTARKSATQKVQHMRACCKKAKLSQETIDILLRQAIQASTPAAPVADPPAASPTLFTDFHPPEPKKRKARPQKAQSTVTGVLESRKEILQRAQIFFQDPESPEAHRSVPEPPPTQQFGRSKLGAAQRTTSLFGDHDPISEQELSDPSPTKKKGQPRFFPSPGHSTDLETIELAPALAAVSLRGEPSRVGGSTLPGRKSPSAKKKVAKARAPRTKAVYDIAWEEKLRGKILDDKDLYLRILRLEPILLDVFIALVSEPGEGKPTSKLKKSLSSYLDKEGIVFYTLERWR